MNRSNISRRHWLQLSSSAALSAAAISASAIAVGDPLAGLAPHSTLMAAEATPQAPVCIFAKPIQWLSFEALADQLAQWKVAGIEATLRKGGQIEPADLEEKLPRLLDALRAKQTDVTIATTDVSNVEQPETEQTLKLFAKQGIKFYRLAFRHYDLNKPILPQLDQFAKQNQKLAQLNASLGLTGLLQNHAGGDYFGGSLWDGYQSLEGIDPKHLGLAFDIRHTAVEAALSWKVDYRLVRSRIASVFVKDARWNDQKLEDVPLGDGPVAKEIFATVARDGIAVPVSLHMEYIDHRKPELLDKSLAAISSDLATLRKWMGQA